MNNTSTLADYGSQTSFSSAGSGAAATLGLTTAMSVAGGVLFLLVMGAVWLARRRNRPGHVWWIWAGGVVLPVLALAALVAASTFTLAAIGRTGDTAPVIEVTGHHYWWDVVHDPQGRALRDANEIVLPADTKVTLRLRSGDVIHSFWVPSIAGKLDMIPGRVNEMTVTATRPGRYRGQCAEFCGLSHPLMAFEVLVLPPAEYAAYLAGLQDEARDADTAQLEQGREVFLREGCPACHVIRGIAEGGRIGPDLSRVGARGSLGAGMWRMNVGNLAGWIADVQDMKPVAEMPSFNHLSGPDLRAVAHYLASLK
ncbi:cytochrome c oxidase subunit II [Anianabacter salinae]|uniref:cytochrome c oxidase subunit II n=1 Tax=Anianabacter salinae TaxID=2851023 RepID=UPI00225E0C9B|nr:cytochrome c oxidase subunit II [Anianabacter salinae]MBV0911189.1 c-type cytochrome [Anianabacter salinae]